MGLILMWIDIYKLGMDYIYHQYNTLKHPLGSKPLAFGGYNRTLNNGPFIFWGGTRMKFACSLLDPVHVRWQGQFKPPCSARRLTG